MIDLGPHAFFIIGSYGATALVLGALIAWAWLSERAQQKLIDALEAQGVSRRGRSRS